jgi:hypothetical protein
VIAEDCAVLSVARADRSHEDVFGAADPFSSCQLGDLRGAEGAVGGTLLVGDAGWERPHAVVEGAVAGAVLGATERAWLAACWKAATLAKAASQPRRRSGATAGGGGKAILDGHRTHDENALSLLREDVLEAPGEHVVDGRGDAT